jgi:hypothetical protein
MKALTGKALLRARKRLEKEPHYRVPSAEGRGLPAETRRLIKKLGKPMRGVSQ